MSEMNSKGISQANHTTEVENSAEHFDPKVFANCRIYICILHNLVHQLRKHAVDLLYRIFFNEELQYFVLITVQEEKISEKHKGEALSAELN